DSQELSKLFRGRKAHPFSFSSRFAAPKECVCIGFQGVFIYGSKVVSHCFKCQDFIFLVECLSLA
ncbi:hypothetical protein KY285_029829, partial [Solanum tuberosum]